MSGRSGNGGQQKMRIRPFMVGLHTQILVLYQACLLVLREKSIFLKRNLECYGRIIRDIRTIRQFLMRN